MTLELIKIIYIICLFICFGYVISMIYDGEQHNIYNLCVALLITDGIIGHMIIVNSVHIETALLGNRMVYVSGCFLPLLLFLILAKICSIKISDYLVGALLIFSLLTLFVSWTQGIFDFFYKEVSLSYSEGFPVIEKEYGPLHMIFLVLLIAYAIAIAGMSVFALIKRRRASAINIIIFFGTCGIIGLTYFGERFFDLKVDYVPVAYTIGFIMFSRIFREFDLFEMNMGLINARSRQQNIPYVMFDLKNRITACNDRIKKVFPEIAGIYIDSKSSVYNETDVYKLIYKPLFEDGLQESPEFVKYGQTYKAFKSNVFNDRTGEQIGTLVGLRDVTYITKMREIMEQSQDRLEKEVESNTFHVEEIRSSIISGMAAMIESRDSSTGGHILRTSDVVRIFAEHLEESGYPVSHAFLKYVELAAPLHDLGKMMVDDEVLRKQGKYTAEEFEKMKKHPEEGAKLVRKVLSGCANPGLVDVSVNVAHYHHEKWNGQGYPDGLKGTEIPLEARIMALADVFDALVSRRCYKDAYSYNQAFKIIASSDGSHFDPELVKYFIECRPELEKLYDGYGPV